MTFLGGAFFQMDDNRQFAINQKSWSIEGSDRILAVGLKHYHAMRYLILLLVLLVFGCSPSVSIYHDYDRQINISTFSTYGWKSNAQKESANSPIYTNELNDKRIKVAADKGLQSKGYQLTDEEPQLILHYHIIVEDRSVVTQDPYYHHYSPYWIGMDVNTYQYKQGTLIIDLMDAKTEGLLWRGWAVSVLDELHPDKVEQRLNDAIQKILAPLPASTKK